MKTLRDFDLKNKRVLVRCDFNVPLAQKRGIILDDFRIKQSIPTIQYLLEQGAKIILMSHLGRPDGEVVEDLRLTPIQDKLRKYLNVPITKAKDCIGKEVEELTCNLEPGGILLLENLRFHKEEKENDENFAMELAKLGEIYINDAFSVCHRAHASVVGIPKYRPAGAGFLLEKEVKILSQIIKNPKRPLLVIIGGSKVEDKARVVANFFGIADFILVGNLIAKEIKARQMKIKHPEKIFFPLDNKNNLDIGEKTVKLFKEKISKAKTIFWAGPLGKIEEEEYQNGTKEIAETIIKSGAFSVIGGGDTIEFIDKIGLAEKFNYVSIGGGAMLAFLAGKKLPGLEALKDGD